MGKVLGVVAAVALSALVLSGVAGAQEAYPPPDQGGSSTVVQGGSFSFSSDGWAPGSQVTVTLESTPVVLGTFTADGNGRVEGTVTIPSGTSVGPHDVVLTGTDPSGNPRTVTLSLTVVAGPADAAALAFTGSNNSGAITAAGVIAVLVGAALVMAARKRRASVPSA